MSLIREIIKDDKKSGSSNFNLMIATESSVRVTFDQVGDSTIDTSKIFPFVLSKMSKSVALITISYLGITAYSKEVADGDNIFTYQGSITSESSLIVKVISLSLDEKMNDGFESGTRVPRTTSGSELLFGFVNDAKGRNKRYSTITYHDDYIPGVSELSGVVTTPNKYEKKISLPFHAGVIAFMDGLWSHGREVNTFDYYSEKIGNFEKEFGINPRMLLYVKTIKNGKIHSQNDLPAITWVNGRQEWYKEGKLHRDNAPAIQKDARNSFKSWYQNGILSRIDGPAVLFMGESNNSIQHWLNNKRHSEDNKPTYVSNNFLEDSSIKESDIKSIYWKYGMKHHVTLPAYKEEKTTDRISHSRLITDLEEKWYQFDRLYRIEGPTIVITRFDNVGDIKTVTRRQSEWLHDGKLDRTDGPALITEYYSIDGKIYNIQNNWYSEGNRHRIDGPAISNNYPSDEIRNKMTALMNEYYFKGNFVGNIKEVKKLYELEQKNQTRR